MTLRSHYRQIDDHSREGRGNPSFAGGYSCDHRPVGNGAGRVTQGYPSCLTLTNPWTTRPVLLASLTGHPLYGSNDLQSLTAGGRSRRNGCALGCQTGVGAVPLCGVHRRPAIRFTGHPIPMLPAGLPGEQVRRGFLPVALRPRTRLALSAVVVRAQFVRAVSRPLRFDVSHYACQGFRYVPHRHLERRSYAVGFNANRHSYGAFTRAQIPFAFGANENE